MDVRRSRQGQDAPSANPRRGCEPGARSAEGALRGVLSFGYFSLHKQRKVTRRQAKAFAVAFKLPNEATTSTTTAEAKLSPLRASYFSLLAQRKGNQKKARPASRPPRCALRVRVHRGDPRKGHPAPAADGVHPCTPPFGYFPAMAAASEGNPVRQQQQQSKSKDQSDSNSNSNSDCKSKSKSKSKFKIGNSNNTSDSNSGADNAPL
ncbi:hypothetical protein [uncultured Xanthomonas sp.]|uniref:hypothetical protein n=1 Tax=uncultured Xanthomonas sp. TaxID=152831 RepID=UPI0025CD5922|nr:hypothetical protein [uncultured Xanthomonas sp.]